MGMKSLAELAAIRDKMKDKVAIREGNNEIRIVVGMATCGIAAGARPVLNTFVEEIAKEDLTDKATVSQTGCIGMCRYEPIVEVTLPGQEKVTYVHVKPEMVARIVSEHVVNGNPVVEYTIGAAEK